MMVGRRWSPEVVVVSHGEIGTKSSKVRAKMERRLAANLDAILTDRGIPAEVERRWSRLLVWSDAPDAAAAAAAAAAQTPGVVWARPAAVCEPTLDAVCEALSDAASTHPEGATFAVDASRAGSADAHPFTSGDVEREGGSVIVDATGAPVDLDAPERTYRAECRAEEAFVSVRTYAGPGGLPLGTQGSAVALLSGGIDSPVAAWEMMRRGCAVVPVYVGLGGYGGPDHEARAASTARALARRAPNFDLRLRVVPAGEVVQTLVDEVRETRMLSLRRTMLRVAEAVARDADAHSIVTGESIGQKSSQTGPNLAVTDAAVDLPVHRPLLAVDKTEITDRARDLGTYDDSTLPVGCERVAPRYPETNATLETVRAAEPADLLDRAAGAVDRMRIVDLDAETP